MVWDVTVPDSMAPSYRSVAVSGTGSVAALAEAKKSSKYAHLSTSFSFFPVAIESLGALGPLSRSFIKSLGQRICRYTGDELAGHYLLQRLYDGSEMERLSHYGLHPFLFCLFVSIIIIFSFFFFFLLYSLFSFSLFYYYYLLFVLFSQFLFLSVLFMSLLHKDIVPIISIIV